MPLPGPPPLSYSHQSGYAPRGTSGTTIVAAPMRTCPASGTLAKGSHCSTGGRSLANRARPDPGSAPGSGLARLANDLPPVEQWLPFASVPDAGQVRSGAATIVVPDVPRGSYPLWWLY